MCLDRVETRAGGQEGLKCDQASIFSRSARYAAEPTDSTPNVVTCHVTVISWLGRERHAPFLIRNRKKSIRDFLMARFLNAREQLYDVAALLSGVIRYVSRNGPLSGSQPLAYSEGVSAKVGDVARPPNAVRAQQHRASQLNISCMW